MSMTAKRVDLQPKKRWKREGQDIWVTCPDCGLRATLSRHKHTIDDDGLVTPSLICITETCDFHEHVRLVGWRKDDDQQAVPGPETSSPAT